MRPAGRSPFTCEETEAEKACGISSRPWRQSLPSCSSSGLWTLSWATRPTPPPHCRASPQPPAPGSPLGPLLCPQLFRLSAAGRAPAFPVGRRGEDSQALGRSVSCLSAWPLPALTPGHFWMQGRPQCGLQTSHRENRAKGPGGGRVSSAGLAQSTYLCFDFLPAQQCQKVQFIVCLL